MRGTGTGVAAKSHCSIATGIWGSQTTMVERTVPKLGSVEVATFGGMTCLVTEKT